MRRSRGTLHVRSVLGAVLISSLVAAILSRLVALHGNHYLDLALVHYLDVDLSQQVPFSYYFGPSNGTANSSTPTHTSTRTTSNGSTNDGAMYRRTDGGFACCLLIKDSNSWLTEWIAYHILVLPMKELIVAVDPHSVQSPLSILRRFNASTSGLDLDITLWHDEDYLADVINEMPLYPPLGAPPHLWTDRIRQRYLFRQNIFMSRCLAEIQRRRSSGGERGENGAEWVFLHDVDEFITFHRDGINVLGKELMPQYGEGTILDYIKATQHDTKSIFYSEPCLPIPRLLFGSKESSKEQISSNVPPGFDPLQFNTLRYRHHVSEGSPSLSGFVKPIINVRRSSRDAFDVPATDPHCPYHKVGQICRNYTIMHHLKGYDDSPLIMNHYVGSWEAFSFGRKWFLERFNETKEVSGGQKDEIRPWLSAFVGRFGSAKAAMLLEGAGEVHYDYGPLRGERLGVPYGHSDEVLKQVLAEEKIKEKQRQEKAKKQKFTTKIKNFRRKGEKVIIPSV
mmetsp:Transcript_25628/g.56095  ORF Transcript_25628/g.56095 Transcript_25628/m.56095 type:complete len:509 (+) Transcript_25628:112-1638(+)